MLSMSKEIIWIKCHKICSVLNTALLGMITGEIWFGRVTVFHHVKKRAEFPHGFSPMFLVLRAYLQDGRQAPEGGVWPSWRMDLRATDRTSRSWMAIGRHYKLQEMRTQTCLRQNACDCVGRPAGDAAHTRQGLRADATACCLRSSRWCLRGLPFLSQRQTLSQLPSVTPNYRGINPDASYCRTMTERGEWQSGADDWGRNSIRILFCGWWTRRRERTPPAAVAMDATWQSCEHCAFYF